MKTTILIWLCLIFVALPEVTRSQNFCYKHYTTEDGLPSSCLYSICQDKYGFLWISTDRGLSRFDGNSFLNFDVNNVLPTNIVSSAYADQSSDDVFVGCVYGICVIKNGCFVAKSPIKATDSVQNVDVLLKNANLLYLFKKNHQVNVFDIKTGTKYIDNLNRADNLDPATAICLTRQKRVLTGRSSGLYQFNTNFIQTPIDVKELNTKKIVNITEATDGHLFVSTPEIIYELANYKVIDSIRPSSVNQIGFMAFKTSQGILWIIDRKGEVYIASKKEGGPYTCENITQSLGLKNAGANDILEDNMHNIWITTFNHGLYCIYNSVAEHYAEKQGLINTFVNAVYVDRHENMYIATHGGVYIKPFNQPFRQAKAQNYSYQFLAYKSRLICLVAASEPFLMPEQNVPLSFLPQTDFDSLVYVLARRAFIYKNTMAMYQWNTGLTFRDLETGKERFVELGLTTGSVNKIYTTNGIDYWIGTTFGLLKVNCQTGKYERIRIIRSKVNDILYGMNKTLFIAADDGLYYLANGQWQVIREYKRHKIANLSSLAIDNQQRLWTATNNGILLGKSSGYFQELTGYPNIISNEVNSLTYDSVNHKMFVGTYEGLSIIDMDKFDSLQERLPDVVSLYVLAGDSIYYDMSAVKLKADVKNISLHYTAIELPASKSLCFKYKIDDANWEITTERSINLAGLLPGDHQIRIQASPNGIYWGTIKDIYLLVPTPFYKTVWFRVFISLLVVGLIYLLFRYSIGLVQHQANEKMQMRNLIEELRYQGLAATINPHFIFNSLASIQSYINTNEKLAASEYLAKFSRLIRMTLYKANSKKISIHDELQRLEYYVELEKQRCTEDFEFVKYVDPEIDTRHCFIPNMIIQPLIENAITHGILPLSQGGVIKLFFKKELNTLVIEVRDNGVGIEASERKSNTRFNHNGIALQNIMQRISLIDDVTMEIINKAILEHGLRGTLIRITLPWSYTTSEASHNSAE